MRSRTTRRPSLRPTPTSGSVPVISTAVVVLLAATLVAPRPAEAARPPVHVALGDSYTAGPFIPDPIGTPVGCLRSGRSWARLLAASTGARLRDASCAGATVTRLGRRQIVLGGPNPAQLARVDDDATLVTLQIGGNDLGFGSILVRCLALWPVGSPCRNRYIRDGVDTLAVRIARLAPRIGAAIDAVRRRAPRARIVLVGYPLILPRAGNGCWPRMPFTPTDVAYLRSIHFRLERALAVQARAHRAVWVDLAGPSTGHDACAPAPQRWVEPLVPAVDAAPVHPNATGMAAFAGIVRRRLAGVS
ncbi:MAG: SGNH/GDSL hydrolase family protein [Actinomycetota bacterium]